MSDQIVTNPKQIAYEQMAKMIDALMGAYSYYMKEHPRSSDHMKQLGIRLKEILFNFIFKNELPVLGGPSDEEKKKSICVNMDFKVNSQKDIKLTEEKLVETKEPEIKQEEKKPEEGRKRVNS